MKVTKIWDGTDPGATPGRVFTASIGQETIVKGGGELSYLKMGLLGVVSTGAVTVEDFAGALPEYVLRVGAQERIVMSAADLCALMMFYYKEIPVIGENTDNTGHTMIGGIKIPVYAKTPADVPINHAATMVDVTNMSVETIGVSGYWDTEEKDRKAIHAVKISHTTAAAAGIETLSFRIAPLGRLIGLIVKQVNDFTDANIDISVQRVRILADGILHSQFNCLTDRMNVAPVDYVTPLPIGDLFRLYTILDLRPAGIDTKGQELNVQLDIQDVSDAISIIPVIEMQ